jgi:nickel-dependent lactate racemase
MSGIEYTDEMAEEIIKEIPEGVDEAALAEEKAMEKVSVSKKPKKNYAATSIGKNVNVKCSSSNREASYDSEAQQLTITQNGITIMVSPCKTEKQAIRLAAKF